MSEDHDSRGRITPMLQKNETSPVRVERERRVAPVEHRGSTRRHRHDPPKRDEFLTPYEVLFIHIPVLPILLA